MQRKPISDDYPPEKWMTLSDAKKKIMDYVANRDHSEKELRQKLNTFCEADLIDLALIWAKEQNWLATPDALKDKYADQLHSRGKGILSINQKLIEKGLPTVKSDFETEIAKACKLVFAKWSANDFNGLDLKETQKLKQKIMRFLISRGFETEVIEQILKNELNAKGLSYDEEF
ncbi:MAG: regulatory protein RecX [Pseudobdellovibrio sp.]